MSSKGIALVKSTEQQNPILLRFNSPKNASEVLPLLIGLTNSPNGMLLDSSDLSKAVTLIGSDELQSGTYYWHKIGRDSSDASRAKKAAALVIALVIFGSCVQLVILSIALPACDYNWQCAHGWYKTFISHIDGPFKVMTFLTAVRAAQRQPDYWLGIVGLQWLFNKVNPQQVHDNLEVHKSKKEE